MCNVVGCVVVRNAVGNDHDQTNTKNQDTIRQMIILRARKILFNRGTSTLHHFKVVTSKLSNKNPIRRLHKIMHAKARCPIG